MDVKSKGNLHVGQATLKVPTHRLLILQKATDGQHSAKCIAELVAVKLVGDFYSQLGWIL